MASGYGITSGGITVSGITRDDESRALVNFLLAAAFDGTIIQARVEDDGTGEVLFRAPYLVTSMGRAGGYNNAETFDMALTPTTGPEGD